MKYDAQSKYRLRLILIQFMVFMPTHPEINRIKWELRNERV